jgi:hypothetical protein
MRDDRASARVLVADNRTLGAAAGDVGTVLALSDAIVSGTRPSAGDTFGRGLEANTGARLEARRVLVVDNHEAGVMFIGPVTTASLTDTIVAGVASSARGIGAGALVFGGAEVIVARLALTDVRGAALAALPIDDARNGHLANARVTGGDVFVRGVRSSTIRFDDSGTTLVPTGRLVAYGLHVGAACSLDLAHAVVAGGGFGFFAARGGALAVHTGLITGQLDACGASNTSPDAVVLEDVARSGNAVNDVLRDLDLPEAAALPTPTPVCADAACL